MKRQRSGLKEDNAARICRAEGRVLERKSYANKSSFFLQKATTPEIRIEVFSINPKSLTE
jgi:hypothetical protein